MLPFKVSATISFSVLLCLISSITTIKAAPEYLSHFCPNSTTFSPNTTYATNLGNLFSWLSANSTRDNGYYNTTTGTTNSPGNIVYGAFLCRGDLSTNECQECVSTAAKAVRERCPEEKESVIWYAECMLRYSNQSFFSVPSSVPMVFLFNTANVSEQTRFNQLLGDTIKQAANQAANGGADKKFATKDANFTSFITLYTLAQCTPDLSVQDCNTCLEGAIANLPICCDGKQGGRVLIPSCNIRYEVYPFYHNVSPSVPTPEKPRPTPKEKSRSTGTILAIVIPIVLSLLLFFICCWLISRRPKKEYNSVSLSGENVEISNEDLLQLDLDTIKVATNNFCEDNKLGEGGFGEVYKGSLPNGLDIAVKRLSSSSRQGREEFKNEVLLVAKLQHRNLVRLLGFCLDGEEKILVYEYVPNKSLDHFLFDPEKQQLLNWSRRIFGVDQTQGNTSRIVGTLGYMPPEYAMHGHISVKIDVYSFGILVLEIICGQKNTSFNESGTSEDLVNYAWKNWIGGTPLALLDATLEASYSRDEVIRCVHIGLLCVQEDPARRPTMQQIVLLLNSYSISLATPERPPSYLHSQTQPSFPTKGLDFDKSTTKSTSANVDEASITGVYPR
ncbi:hypothetical protein L6164_032167 [Bauhinia variegata]|uniref:Uncharacterized protein n=1 Tax=Bauhinia variegata TaxID=167791 RepID=A0ACB9KMZ7_BAUVA|nr:hypothetical protein L6164_032167 [Bauhinia variegata]